MPDHGYECPLCGLESSELNDIYTHLMTNHRKSAISNALLEETGVRIESPGASPLTQSGSVAEELGRE